MLVGKKGILVSLRDMVSEFINSCYTLEFSQLTEKGVSVSPLKKKNKKHKCKVNLISLNIK